MFAIPFSMTRAFDRDLATDSTESDAWDFVALLKPGVMSLVIFSALLGIILAPGVLHPFVAAVAILCIAVGCGGAAALNMWYDRDIDSVMERTKNRPIPAKRIAPHDALTFGVILSFGSVFVLSLATNWIAGSILAGSIAFYVFIYTVWLKRRTPQNIVIGGAAGAFPPLIGWAVVTGGVSLEALILFLIIFIWTPPHFWALALYRSGDYEKAGVPMLPVVVGPRKTKIQILLYTIALVVTSLLPWGLGYLSIFYGATALGLGGYFLFCAVQVYGFSSEKYAKKLFGFSILYLFLLFSGMILDHLIVG